MDLEAPVPRSRPRLSWNDAAGSHAVELRDARTAGSAPGCEIVVSDRAVSRVHAELSAREDGLWVKDLGSKNGTYLAGVKIAEARVPPGAPLRLGSTEIAVSYGTPRPPEDLWPRVDLGPLLGRSAVMSELFARIVALAGMDLPVLFVGEPGTGKNALARALHDASPSAAGPYVVVDCATLPEPVRAAEVLEEALRNAEGGTLVFDEPSELPIGIQRELVPPLQARAFRAVATSTRDLRHLVNQGAFREALYFRFAGAMVTVPPLRERLSDLPLLLARFLGDRADLATSDLLSDLSQMPWTGNVAELAQYAERMLASGGKWNEFPMRREAIGERTLDVTMDIPLQDDNVQPSGAVPIAPLRLPPGTEPWMEIGFKEFREKWIEIGEREYLRRLMLRTNRSSSAASREAGLERTYLYRLLKKHGV